MDIKQGNKNDPGKLRYDLLPPEAIEELVKIYTDGANVYGDRNWEQGIKYTRIYAAILRHLQAFMMGEDRDTESGHLHICHAAWGCIALTQYMLCGLTQFDDRRPKRKGRSEDRPKS